MKDWFMNIDEVQLITFSPTCTSKQVGEAIVHGTGISSVSKVDLTLEAAGCSGEMRRYTEEHQWRRRPAGH